MVPEVLRNLMERLSIAFLLIAACVLGMAVVAPVASAGGCVHLSDPETKVDCVSDTAMDAYQGAVSVLGRATP